MKLRWPNHMYQKEIKAHGTTNDLRIVFFYFTIYVLQNYLETNLINPWNSINIWFWLNQSHEKNHHQDYVKNSEWEVTYEHSSSLLCLKLIWPQHQRHLLLKGRTNVYIFIKSTVSLVFLISGSQKSDKLNSIEVDLNENENLKRKK